MERVPGNKVTQILNCEHVSVVKYVWPCYTLFYNRHDFNIQFRSPVKSTWMTRTWTISKVAYAPDPVPDVSESRKCENEGIA